MTCAGSTRSRRSPHRPQRAGALAARPSWTPFFVVGDRPEPMHEAMTSTLDMVIEDVRRIQHEARVNGAQRLEPRTARHGLVLISRFVWRPRCVP
jgi:phosphoketolase